MKCENCRKETRETDHDADGRELCVYCMRLLKNLCIANLKQKMAHLKAERDEAIEFTKTIAATDHYHVIHPEDSQEARDFLQRISEEEKACPHDS